MLARPERGAPVIGGMGILVVGVFVTGCPLSDEGVCLNEDEEECLGRRMSANAV